MTHKTTNSKINYHSMTTTQVATILCVAPRTVAKWADSGKMKCWKINKDRRFDILDLIEFAKENNYENLLSKINILEIIKNSDNNNSITQNNIFQTEEYKTIIKEMNIKICQYKLIIEDVASCIGQGQVKMVLGSDECKINLSKRNELVRKIELLGL